MKRELMADDELGAVTGGAQTVQISTSAVSEKNSPPTWIDDIKSEMNFDELVPTNRGSFIQKFKGIFQRMQLD